MKENWQVHWMDYYKILQIDPGAEIEVVKAAYAKLAFKYHPDHNSSPNATEKMRLLNEAFYIINDPSKREAYDANYRQIKDNQTSGSSQTNKDPNTQQRWGQQRQKPIIIGVCGRSCSGKGVATEPLASNNRNVLLLQSDYYFYEKTPCSYKGYSSWEHTNCVDFDRLIRDIGSFKRGEGISIKTPAWMSQPKVHISSEDLSTKKLIIIDGFLIFVVKQLADLFDYKIFVDASDYTILMRRTEREGSGVYNYVHDVVIPVSKEYERIQKDAANVIIDGEKSKDNGVKDVSQFLQQNLSGTGFILGQSPWKVRPGDLVQDSVWHPIDFADLKDWVRNQKGKLDHGELKGHTFRYRKNRQTGTYEVRLSTQHKPRICRYNREPT